jgi:tRNA(fMet)-specific endonuclease VapC
VRPWPLEAAHHCAAIRFALERAGKPIGWMDMLIAAHAIAEDGAIITNNAREFHRAPRLAVEERASLV